MQDTSEPVHVERLTASPAWWAAIAAFAAAVGWLLLVAVPAAVAAAVAVLLAVALAIPLWRAGGLTVSAGPGRLRAGDAHLEHPHLGGVTPLDREAWRVATARAGADRAFVSTRPWMDRGVRVEVADPADPTPYWLVASRYPGALTHAVGHTGPSTGDAGDPIDEGTEDGQEARDAGRGDDLD